MGVAVAVAKGRGGDRHPRAASSLRALVMLVPVLEGVWIRVRVKLRPALWLRGVGRSAVAGARALAVHHLVGLAVWSGAVVAAPTEAVPSSSDAVSSPAVAAVSTIRPGLFQLGLLATPLASFLCQGDAFSDPTEDPVGGRSRQTARSGDVGVGAVPGADAVHAAADHVVVLVLVHRVSPVATRTARPTIGLLLLLLLLVSVLRSGHQGKV